MVDEFSEESTVTDISPILVQLAETPPSDGRRELAIAGARAALAWEVASDTGRRFGLIVELLTDAVKFLAVGLVLRVIR